MVLCRDADGTTKVELLGASCCKPEAVPDDRCGCLEGSKEGMKTASLACERCTDTLLPDAPALRQTDDHRAYPELALEWAVATTPALSVMPLPASVRVGQFTPRSSSNTPLSHLQAVVLRI